MTLNGIVAVILRYFTKLGRFGGQLRHSGRSYRPVLSATKNVGQGIWFVII